jgi:hypothetical protein
MRFAQPACRIAKSLALREPGSYLFVVCRGRGGAGVRAMNRAFQATILASVLLVGGPIVIETSGAATLLAVLHERIAQAQTPEPILPTSRTVNLTQENRHVIREIILKDMNVKKAPDNIHISIGGPVPSNVSTQPFPGDVTQKIPALKSNTFFVTGDQIVVVEPKDNTVADIVK